MMTHRLLLALSTSRYSRHLVEHALDEAKVLLRAGDAVHIDVLYVIEEAELARVGRIIGEAGFLGQSPKDEIVEALGAEHHRTALRRVAEIRERAAALGVQVDFIEVTDDFVAAVIGQAESVAYDVILITRADRPFISRLLFGSESDRVARLVRQENLGRLIIDEAERT